MTEVSLSPDDLYEVQQAQIEAVPMAKQLLDVLLAPEREEPVVSIDVVRALRAGCMAMAAIITHHIHRDHQMEIADAFGEYIASCVTEMRGDAEETME